MYRENEARLIRFGLDLLPQVHDVRVNRSGSGKAIVTPDFLEQAIAAQCLAFVAKKILQQRKLRRREI